LRVKKWLKSPDRKPLRKCRALHYTEDMNDPESESVLPVKIPIDLAKRVERVAEKLGISSAEVVQTAIRQGLKQAAEVSPQSRKASAMPKNR